MSSQLYDVIVVGGGAIGLGAAYEVAKAAKSVLVLEQSCLFNAAGSSNDLARMYRTMYTEPFMAELAYQSMSIWKELERDSGTSLRTTTGLLNFGDLRWGKTRQKVLIRGTLMGPVANLENLDMPFRKMTKQDMEREYPFKDLPDTWEGIYAPDNGIINVPLLLRTLSRLAKDYGAHTQQYTEVTKLVPKEENDEDIWKVEARVNGDEVVSFRARKITIAAGAYTNHILQPSFGIKLKLNIWEMVATYYTVNAGPNGTHFPSMWFQFANDKNAQYLQGGAKDSVVVFTAGWAMKFVPLLGRALKDMVLNGHSDYALEEFKIDRLDPKSKGKDGTPKAGILEIDDDFSNRWEYVR
ncbi:FAD dependent oxidoreductase [Seiridium cupressi]